jgi:BTB/POZ domain
MSIVQSSDLTSSRMISGPKVDVYVGPDRKHYSLPKLLLCHYSQFFDRCFNGGFAEAISQSLDLPGDRVEDFEILLEYILRGTSGSMKITEVSTEEYHIQQCSLPLTGFGELVLMFLEDWRLGRATLHRFHLVCRHIRSRSSC